MRRKRGVITVFTSLLLVAVLSFMGTVTEGVRIFGARMQAQTVSDCAIDSLLSEYDPFLMENYHLFFFNGMEGESVFLQENMSANMKEYMSYNLSPTSAHSLLTHKDFWQLTIEDCLVKEYRLATDNGCSAYRQQAADTMKGSIGTGLLTTLKEWAKEPMSMEQLETSLDEREKENEKRVTQIKKEVQEGASQETMDGDIQVEKVDDAMDSVETTVAVNERDNPIAIIKELKEKGILQFVMPSDYKVSEKELKSEDFVSKRKLNVGNAGEEVIKGWDELEETVLFHEYLLHCFSNALEEKATMLPKGRALDYEIEYILAGKDSDVENLKSIVHRLLLIREAVNYGYLLTDTVKQLQAETVAVAICGAVGMMALTAVVKHGILLAWAYGESVLDVRQLMAGGTISAIETGTTWKLQLENFHFLTEAFGEEPESQEGGLSYKDYLRILMFAENEQTLTLRSLDMLEQTMRKQPGKSDYMVDALIGEVSMVTTFRTKPVFLSLWPKDEKEELQTYTVQSKGQYIN